ncbi:MAG TPA: transporter [Vulgatibacter sp.]|nr:transporter [Vulgatibacter sp.]
MGPLRLRPPAGTLLAATLTAACLACALPARAQQNLGHKVLGTLGLRAGYQQDPGVYVADRVLFFHADRVADRNGDRTPVDVDAFANAVGGSAIFRIEPLSTFVGASISLQLVRVRTRVRETGMENDRVGLGDLFVQPIRLGWRLGEHFDLLAGYGFYAPTGKFDLGPPQSGVGRGYWTPEPTLGGTIYFDRRQGWNVTALASYNFNGELRGVDVIRGNTFQIQGAAGAHLFRIVEAGVATYAFWQVSDDEGREVPPAIRGARARAFGLGPEVAVTIPLLRSRLSGRWVHDVYTRTRPIGQLFTVGLIVNLWSPSTKREEP